MIGKKMKGEQDGTERIGEGRCGITVGISQRDFVERKALIMETAGRKGKVVKLVCKKERNDDNYGK